jgi:peptidoglycan/LPS O-acetylase OafA/YrhL
MMMRYGVLDSWRGLCALLVACHHFLAAGDLLAAPFIRGAYLFVDFFFVLSGFVVTHAYADRLRGTAGLQDFLIRRVGRLWPLHAFTLLAMIALEGMEFAVGQARMGAGASAAFTGASAPSTILPNALLLHSLGLFDELGWNFPSWSISVEMATYVAFGAAMLALRRHMVSFACAVVLGALLVIALRSTKGMNVTYDLGLFRCLGGFFLGHLVYRLHRLSPGNLAERRTLASLVELLAILATIGFVSGVGQHWPSLLAPFLFAGVVLVFAQEAGLLSRGLAWRPFVLLGTVSYSVYMVHYPIFIAFRKAVLWCESAYGLSLTRQVPNWDGGPDPLVLLDFGRPWLADLAALAFLTFAVGVATLTYRFVEVPGRDAFDRLRRNRAAARGPRPASLAEAEAGGASPVSGGRSLS